jgi:thiol:disulfide interchange protein
VEKAGRDWVMIQVDLTQSGDEAKENLVKRYGIKGVPTLVVIDGQGRERHDLRQTDYLTPDRLLALMAPLTP